jgi:homoserine dehydrogenase
MNAVMVMADAVGPTLYYGPGAGSEPTASAVVADIVDVARVLTADPGNRVPHLAFQADQLADTPVLPIEEVESAYYLRMTARDTPGVLARVATILSNLNINIESLIQKEADEKAGLIPIIMVTRKVQERLMNQALHEIEKIDAIVGSVMRLRLEELNT